VEDIGGPDITEGQRVSFEIIEGDEEPEQLTQRDYEPHKQVDTGKVNLR